MVEKDCFELVNPDWFYVIQIFTALATGPASLKILFQYQPQANLWLAHRGTSEMFLLSGPVVVKLLNESLDRGLTVHAVQPATGHTLTFSYLSEKLHVHET